MTVPAQTHPLRKRDEELDRYINLKLAALGQPVSRHTAGSDFLEIAGTLLRNYYQKDRQLGSWLSVPAIAASRIFSTLTSVMSVRTAPRASPPTPLCWTAKAWPASYHCL